jgi:dATP pyrophosphohydrolase
MSHIPVRPDIVDVFVLRWRSGSWDALALRRARDTRCTGAWEAVHGRIERGERAEEAAVREVREETGLSVGRLYNVTVNPFYLHRPGAVVMAIVFAAVVDADAEITLSPEHDRAEWLSIADAAQRFAWPRARQTVQDIAVLLRGGDAGAVEDVLRVI